MSGRRLLLTRTGTQIWSYLLQEESLMEVQVFSDRTILGNIYVGKVKNVVPQIQAAFVEIAGGQLCFLPLSSEKPPVITNRTGDGRILAGDEILVQVIKEAVKTKDPVVSGDLTFSGTYAVVQTGGEGLHFSSRLSKEQKTALSASLRSYWQTHPLAEGSVVIRTEAGRLAADCGSGTTEEPAEERKVPREEAVPEQQKAAGPLIKELEALRRLAAETIQKGRYRTCFSLLYQEEQPWLSELFKTGTPLLEVITDDSALWERLCAAAKERPGQWADKLRFYEDPRISLSALFGLKRRLEEASAKKVWLKSGGYLVIEPTEALTVIDVNTGKYAGNKSSEEVFFLTNQEAAGEIARQLRLRNLSGIILIDFINLAAQEKRMEILQELRRLVQEDPVRTVVVDMTPLGLVEVTRKKIRKSLAEQLAEAEKDRRQR